MNERKQLHIFSWLFVILAVLDILLVVLDLFSTEVSFEGLGAGAMIFVLVIYLMGLATIAAKLWMGIKGLQYAKGEGKGTSHITLAKISIVLFGICIATSIFSVLGGTEGAVQELFSHVSSTFVLYCYLKAAKAVL